MKKIINPYLGKEGYNCICCSPNNPIGLRLEFWEDGEDVLTKWNPSQNYQGWVINRKLQTTGVTTRLEIKYRKPVLTDETQIIVRGHIAQQRRNIVTIALTLENEKGEICNEGEAVYFTFGEDKAREMGFDGCKVED